MAEPWEKFSTPKPWERFQTSAEIPASAEPSPAMDVAKSFGRGVGKGAMGLVGLPGEAERLVRRGAGKVAEFFGEEPRSESEVEAASILPGAAGVQRAVEKVTGPLGTPKTTAGRYAESVGEFIPSAFIGPGGIAGKAAMTIGGGLGAQLAGEISGEAPWARFLGGLFGGAGLGAAAMEAQAVQAARQLKNIPEIEKAADQAYDFIAQSRSAVKPGAVGDLSVKIKTDLDNDLITPPDAPKTFKALEQLEKGGGDIANLMSVSKRLGRRVEPKDGDDYYAALQVRDAIDDFLENVQPKDIIKGDTAFDKSMWDYAKGNWRAKRQAERVLAAKKIGEHIASTSGTGANVQNAMLQRIRSIVDSDKKSRGYSPEVKAKMEKIVQVTLPSHIMRYLGKYSPRSSVSIWPAIFTGEMAGPVAGVAVGVGTELSRQLGTLLTKRQIRELTDMIRSEAPINKPIAKQFKPQKFEQVLPAAGTRTSLAEMTARPSLEQMAQEPDQPSRITMPMPYGQSQ